MEKSKILKYLMPTVAWLVIVGYLVYSTRSAVQVSENQKVTEVEILIRDSAQYGNLVTTPMVSKWIASSGVKLKGQNIKSLELVELEGRFRSNGFVDKATIYPTRSGVLKIEISQRRPTLRLLANGYNAYSTAEGYIFASPASTAVYVPVVTGDYKPPFPPSFSGDLEQFLREELERLDEKIAEVEREKYPFFEQEKQNNDDRRELRRMFIKRQWWRLESHEAFDKRVLALREEKARLRKLYTYRERVIDKRIDAVTAKQEALQRDKKKLVKKCEDFRKLINFVENVDKDDFWGSEIVQIIASQSQSGELRVSFSVRSGDFKVVFGTVDNMDRKLAKLRTFYRDALKRVGWQKYRLINVEYRDQVVCK